VTLADLGRSRKGPRCPSARATLNTGSPMQQTAVHARTTSLLRLVVFVEERFKITVGGADLLPENFATVNTVGAYLRAREPGQLGAAHA